MHCTLYDLLAIRRRGRKVLVTLSLWRL